MIALNDKALAKCITSRHIDSYTAAANFEQNTDHTVQK